MDYDVLVIGSGFGGSVAALRATEKGYRVGVLEAGRRWEPEDFARTSWNVRRFLWAPRLGCRGIQRLTLLRDVLVLSGAGVGGGSLVYANTLYEPLEPFYDDPQWRGIADWRAELASHYATARRMLGATTVPFETAADRVLRRVARRMGAEETFRATDVAVDLDRCVRSGACMVGCRWGAKNTLDRNYLRLAEDGGAEIHPETEATRLVPSDGGWRVDTRGRSFTARQVVVAAGVLGTLKLLFRSGLGGPRVGELVRTNSEVIVGSAAKRLDVDYSEGLAIGSAFRPRPDTEIQVVRYPRGSNLLGLLGTLLVDGGGTTPRPLRFLATVARHPLLFLRTLSVHRWSERTVLLLVMQARDNSLRVRWTGRRLTSEPGHGERSPAWIPEANEAARHAAAVMDGYPGSSLNEVLLNAPVTAHILGGCAIGASPEAGVVDAYQRVFAHPGLHVLDGSAVTANPGVNPALTITAQAERAMSFWPDHGEPDPRPGLGEPYRGRYAAARRS